jgi:Type VI secretion system/phage-baseplate injector OB domain
VQFHWDRYGKKDDKSSCWIRVSQNWGGKGWGGMFIPHVGQEVIVQFLEGDPDSPLITGRVYNAENMPPVPLPGGKTQSIIRDHGGNEIVMEGAAGGQRMRLFSPTHNTWCHLGNSITWNSDSFWDVTIGGYERVKITTTSHREVGGNTDEQVGGFYHHKTTGGNHFLTVTAGNLQEDISANYFTIVRGQLMKVDVPSGNHETIVGGAHMKANVTSGDYELTAGNNIHIHAGNTYKRTSGHDDEFYKGRSIKKIIGSSEEYLLGGKLIAISPGKSENIAGAEIKKIGGYKSEFTGGWRKEATAGQKYTTQTKQKVTTAASWNWSGGWAKFGSIMKILG